MKILFQILFVICSSFICGVLIYTAFVVWPLNMLPATGLIAALSSGLSWAAVMAIFMHTRSAGSEDEGS